MTPDAGPPDATLFGESKRVAPRSPRAALEPEYMPEPKRPSRRARHPLIIAGNAIFSIILILAIVGGLAWSYGKHKFETAGPLDREKIESLSIRYITIGDGNSEKPEAQREYPYASPGFPLEAIRKLESIN